MAEVWFYEKPGCVSNIKQKQLLMQAGHQVISHNLLKADWDITNLRMFFGDLPTAQWFNCNAPTIKDGWIEPQALDEVQAIKLMVSEPILIRRPLIRVGNEYMVGFDVDAVDKWIGLVNINANTLTQDDLESCPQQKQISYAE